MTASSSAFLLHSPSHPYIALGRLLSVGSLPTTPRVPPYPRATNHVHRYVRLTLTEDSADSLDVDDDATVRAAPSWPQPTLDEELDAIDDVYMDRLPGEGREKVKVFGAWLDADVAGRKAGRGNQAAALIARAERGEQLTKAEEAEVFYEKAIANMRAGKYDTSYSMLEKAVDLAGVDSRRGGEFKLWAVQALQGIGRNAQAVHLLKSMKNHSDRDVRKVSSELLYIAQAPVLKLNDEDFVQFPDVSHLNEGFDKTKWKELAKPSIAPYKKRQRENGGKVGKDVGQKAGGDPMMLVACVGTILALSYVFLV